MGHFHYVSVKPYTGRIYCKQDGWNRFGICFSVEYKSVHITQNEVSLTYHIKYRCYSSRPVARPKSQRVQNHLQWSPQARAATMANSYTLSTQSAKRSAKGCNGMVVQLMVQLRPMHPPGYGPGYRITLGLRYFCHLWRKVSISWVLWYSITSGARCWCHLGRIISVA